MNKLEQAARQALDALESCALVFTESDELDEAIAALREALAEQAEQEPVAWMEDSIEFYASDRPSNTFTIPLYAAPVRTKDLTDEEIAQAVGSPLDEVYLADFRAVVAADREKNK